MTQPVRDLERWGRFWVDREMVVELEEALYAHIGTLWQRKHAGEDINARLREALRAQDYLITLRRERGW